MVDLVKNTSIVNRTTNTTLRLRLYYTVYTTLYSDCRVSQTANKFLPSYEHDEHRRIALALSPYAPIP